MKLDKTSQHERPHLIRSLFDEYIEMYTSRDERLTSRFSDDFSGFTGGGNFLIKNREDWVKITRQDFAQVPGRIRIEMLDISMQDIGAEVVVVTAFFHIRLPIPDHVLSSETARLVLIFRLEDGDWKIVHSGISVPYPLVQAGEVYPLKGLHQRNSILETLVDERTQALEQANRKLELLSNTDGLTGVANRRSFDRVFREEWTRALRAGTSLALVMLDVDNFKLFNDDYGHLAGDDCLRALAQALVKAGRRAGELVARYGGEEFIVLLPDSDIHDAVEAAQRMQHEVWSLALPHAQTVPCIVTFSMGVASLVPSASLNPDDLVGQADAALYRAKASGRNCVHSTVE